jgi:hypothetical protein
MEHLNQIHYLLTKLATYNQTGKVQLSHDDNIILKNIYQKIFKVTANTGCPTCVVHYLNMLQSYYEREAPKTASEAITDQSSQDNQEQVAEQPKRKKKKE